MKDIGIGVVGLGMGRNVLQINSDPTSRLIVTAICDANPERLAEVRAQLPGVSCATEDHRRLIAHPDVQVVAIYTPDHLHIEHIRDALLASKHVLCTKPMVVSLEEAKEVVRLVRRTGKVFFVGQNWRFIPRIMAAKKLFDDGILGRPIMAEAHYVHSMRPVLGRPPWRHEVPQDFLYGGVCHPVDILRSFLGDVDEVFCYATKSGLDARYARHDVPDNYLISMRFKNGTVGRILGAHGVVEPPIERRGFSLYGTKGSFVNDRFVLDDLPSRPVAQLSYDQERGHAQEVLRYLRHFEACVVEGRRPLVDAVEGAKGIATCFAIGRSIETNQPQRVFNEVDRV